MNPSEKQNKELARAVKRYNAKISREIKKNPSMKFFLPPKTSVKKEKQNYTTKREIQRRINSLNRIYNKGSLQAVLTPGGATTTKYELDEMKRLNDYINKQRKRELAKLPKNPEKYGTMGSIEQNTLKPRKFNAGKVSPKEFQKFKETLIRQSKDDYWNKKYELYKQNYLKAVRANMNFEGEKIEDLLNMLSAEEINNAYYTNPFLTIRSIYKKPGESEEDMFYNEQEILNEWLLVIKNNYSNWSNEKKSELQNIMADSDINIREWDAPKRRKKK